MQWYFEDTDASLKTNIKFQLHIMYPAYHYNSQIYPTGDFIHKKIFFVAASTSIDGFVSRDLVIRHLIRKKYIRTFPRHTLLSWCTNMQSVMIYTTAFKVEHTVVSGLNKQRFEVTFQYQAERLRAKQSCGVATAPDSSHHNPVHRQDN